MPQSEFDIDQLLRKNILALKPYEPARKKQPGKDAAIFLDANENAFGSPLEKNFNRYPDPLQQELKDKISHIKGVPSENIFIGNGSHEAIDILFRAFCNPGKDSVIVTPPTFDLYETYANINDVFVKRVPLTSDFQLDTESISEIVNERTKLIFLCSPNDPTGNALNREDVELILNNFEGIVVIDEAYINYSRHRSFIPELTEYPNLVVLQTLSKAWGLAGLGVGMAFASEKMIAVLNSIQQAHTLSAAGVEYALQALDNIQQVNAWTRETVSERTKLANALQQIPLVENVFPSDANFLLVKVKEPRIVHDQLEGKGILVLNCSDKILCEGYLRITIGTPDENAKLLEALRNFPG